MNLFLFLSVLCHVEYNRMEISSAPMQLSIRQVSITCVKTDDTTTLFLYAILIMPGPVLCGWLLGLSLMSWCGMRAWYSHSASQLGWNRLIYRNSFWPSLEVSAWFSAGWLEEQTMHLATVISYFSIHRRKLDDSYLSWNRIISANHAISAFW